MNEFELFHYFYNLKIHINTISSTLLLLLKILKPFKTCWEKQSQILASQHQCQPSFFNFSYVCCFHCNDGYFENSSVIAILHMPVNICAKLHKICCILIVLNIFSVSMVKDNVTLTHDWKNILVLLGLTYSVNRL